MGAFEDIEKGAALLGLGMKLAVKWARWRDKAARVKQAAAEAKAVAALVKLNAVNAKAIAHIEMTMKRAELLEVQNRERFK